MGMAVTVPVPLDLAAYCSFSISLVPAWVPCPLTVSLEINQR
jgi:hypothetical protein